MIEKLLLILWFRKKSKIFVTDTIVTAYLTIVMISCDSSLAVPDIHVVRAGTSAMISIFVQALTSYFSLGMDLKNLYLASVLISSPRYYNFFRSTMHNTPFYLFSLSSIVSLDNLPNPDISRITLSRVISRRRRVFFAFFGQCPESRIQ